jgi:predicted nucleic acid-binding protein
VNRTERLLVDSSVWVAAINPDDRFHGSASELAVADEKPVAALDLTLYEIANVVGARDGRGAQASYLGRLVFERCGEHLLHVAPDLVDAAVEIAAEHGLTAYDAAYVAAARRNGWTLVSADIADLVSKGLAVAPDEADYPKTG